MAGEVPESRGHCAHELSAREIEIGEGVERRGEAQFPSGPWLAKSRRRAIRQDVGVSRCGKAVAEFRRQSFHTNYPAYTRQLFQMEESYNV